MGLFKRNKREEILESDADSADELDFTIPFSRFGEEDPTDGIAPIGHRQEQSTYALTPEEVLQKDRADHPARATQDIPMQSPHAKEKQDLKAAGESLYQRMMQARNEAAQPKPAVREPELTELKPDRPIKMNQAETEPVEAKQAEAKLADAQPSQASLSTHPDNQTVRAETPAPKKEDQTGPIAASAKPTAPKADAPAEKKPSLLDLCKPFIVDEEGNNAAEREPDYTLESVDEIIHSAERKAAERIARLYGARLKTEPSAKEPPKAAPKRAPEPQRPVKVTPSRAARPVAGAPAKKVSEPAPRPAPRVQERAPEEIPMRREPAPVQTQPAPRHTRVQPAANAATQEATQRFDVPSKDEPFDISSGTKIIDIQPPKVKSEPVHPAPKVRAPEPVGSDDYAGPDYTSYRDAKPIRHQLFLQKRRAVLRLLPTLLLAIAALIFATPLLNSFRALHLTAYRGVQFGLIGLLCLLNIDVFRGLGALFTKHDTSDLPVALGLIGALLNDGAVLILADPNPAMSLSLVAAIAILCRDVGRLLQTSAQFESFKLIATPQEKTAFFAIDDKPVTYAMAHDIIPGEALIAAGRKTVNVLDFMRRWSIPGPLQKRNRVIAYLALGVALLLAAIGAANGGIGGALTAFGIALCLSAPPTAALAGILPLKLASDRLGRYGAMLAGYSAAEEIEPVNAAAFQVQELFPSGTVKLIDMKLLGHSVSDQIFFDAAAVAERISSPLTDIFKRIVDTRKGTTLPKADSVKYEDRLGISGWIGDRRLFIGNRTLLEAHGIAAPSLEIDKKILRNGCFPVYLARDGRAQALLIVKYEPQPEITYELSRLCNAGVTILVNNCDPNVTDAMICDYFGLYEDCVKVMNSAASDMHYQAARPVESVSSPAAYQGGSACAPAAVITAAIKVKSTTHAMTMLHIVSLCLGLAAFAYLLFSGKALSILYLCGYQLFCLLCSCMIPWFNRP